MILLIRGNECLEPRVQNYKHYFEEHNIPFHIVGWNRSGNNISDSNTTYYMRKAQYGKRIANIPNKTAWMIFAAKQIVKYRKQVSVIHACDIDAILPALLIGKFFRKRIVFDIFDWISSLTGKGLVYSIVEALQNISFKLSDYVILCERERIKQAKVSNKNVLVLPNIPHVEVVFDKNTEDLILAERPRYKVTISYVGVYDRDRGLENLLQVVSQNPDILLNIAGFGVLENYIQKYAERFKNIKNWRRVEYAVGQTIIKNSDLMAAMYYLTSPLHKYAAPNKYYESLKLGIPLITTNSTLVGVKVNRFKTGFVIGETVDELEQLLSNPDLEVLIKDRSNRCKVVWENKYEKYFEVFMKEKYCRIINNEK